MGNKALAMTSDCTPRYCQADPKTGGMQAVAESWRNLTAVGARPLAVTDNMNFGNPQRPEIMGQFALAIEGMAEACIALDYPVVSGNVSLYNETNGKGILPTPTIGGVGVIADARKSPKIAFKNAEEAIYLVGETAGWLGCSVYLREIEGPRGGCAPAGRPGGRAPQRRFRPQPDRSREDHRLPRRLRWRHPGRGHRDGHGLGNWRPVARPSEGKPRPCLLVWRGSVALCPYGA